MKTSQQQMVMQVLASMNISTLSPPETVKMEVLENAIAHGYQLGLSMGAATGREQWEEKTFYELFLALLGTHLSLADAMADAETALMLLKTRAEKRK